MGQGMSQEELDMIDYVAQITGARKADVKSDYTQFKEDHPEGKVDERGFHELMARCCPAHDEPTIEPLKQHVFRMFDINGDGTITFKELMVVLTIVRKGDSGKIIHEKSDYIFRIFDIDNDGTIGKQELETIIKNLYCLSGKEDRVDETLAKLLELDGDEDIRITKKEFMAACECVEEIRSLLRDGLTYVMSKFT